MTSKKSQDKSLLDVTKAVYEALAPLDIETRKRVVNSVFSLLGMEGTASVPSGVGGQPMTSTTRPQTPSSDRPVTPLELIQEKVPKTHPQRLALFAYYREKHEGNPRFARNDLKSYYSKAKLQPPQNFDRDFNNAVKLGYIYEDGSESYLTSKGLEAVEAGFAVKTQPKVRTASKNKTKISKRRKSK